MRLPDYSPADVQRLVITARSAMLMIDADLFVEKREMRKRDGRGGLLPFDRRALSSDDRSWIEPRERRAAALNEALAAFGLALPNPAGIA